MHYHLKQAREAIERAEKTVRGSTASATEEHSKDTYECHQRKLRQTLNNLLSAVNELSRWAEKHVRGENE